MYNILYIKQHSANTFVVRGGNIINYKEELTKLRGSYNNNLYGGPGWIFSNKQINIVSNYITTINNKHKYNIDIHTMPEIINTTKASSKYKSNINNCLESGIKMTDMPYIQKFSNKHNKNNKNNSTQSHEFSNNNLVQYSKYCKYCKYILPMCILLAIVYVH